MDLEQAVQTHGEWKLKLRMAIVKKEPVDAVTLGRDNCCTVGQWLHNEGKARFSGRAEFQNAMEKHRAFHAEAGKVAGLINLGKYAEAETALGANTPYSTASSQVGGALIGLKRAAGL